MDKALKKPSILEYFPGKPRPSQVATLLEIERAWDEADVIILALPVAAGKSFIGQTIARWSFSVRQLKSRTLVPNNILVEQMLKDFPYLHTLPAAHSFTCVNSIKKDHETGIEYSHSCSKEKGKGEKVYCSGCPTLKLRRKVTCIRTESTIYTRTWPMHTIGPSSL